MISFHILISVFVSHFIQVRAARSSDIHDALTSKISKERILKECEGMLSANNCPVLAVSYLYQLNLIDSIFTLSIERCEPIFYLFAFVALTVIITCIMISYIVGSITCIAGLISTFVTLSSSLLELSQFGYYNYYHKCNMF